MATTFKQGGTSVLPTSAKVTPIRPRIKIPKRNSDTDEPTIAYAKLAAIYDGKAAAAEPGSEEHRFAQHMANIRRKVPSCNLRLIHSTLDERRDFDLRCAEVEVAKAEHALEAKKIGVIDELSPELPWWECPIRKPLVDANNVRWDAYRARLLEMAETPARTRRQLDRKISLIGKQWLQCEGEFYQRMRDAVAADQAWLDENEPKRRRAARTMQAGA